MTFLDRIRKQAEATPAYYEAPTGAFRRYDQNVNLLGPHPAVRESMDLDGLHLYPNRDNRPLLEALSTAMGRAPENYVVGNGSDEILDLLLRVLVAPGGRVAVCPPTYSMYPTMARLNRLELVECPLDDSFQAQPNLLLAGKADLMLLCSPNNPTGTTISRSDLTAILQTYNGPVVLDEAYADFASTTALDLVDKFPNLIVVRTLSKAYGLAGLRVGYAVAHADVAGLLRNAKLPFSLNLLSEQIAVRALTDPKPVRTAASVITCERERLAAGLRARGFFVWPSEANFLLTRPPSSIATETLEGDLRAEGILVRRYADPRLRGTVRFTVGAASDTDALLQGIDAVMRRANRLEAAA